MHFEVEIEPLLAAAIAPTYDAGNYTGAIVAAIQMLSDVIRNKSGLESDGQTLVGQAFGGTNPIIKINALRTESEKDEQKGVEALLRGVYTGIRNPRTHETHRDTVDTANTIILFLNWVLRVLEGSKSPFDPDDIIERVLDEHFVPNGNYPVLLAEQVPPRIRLDVLVRLMEKISFLKAANARAFTRAVLALMSANEQEQFWDMVSAKLLTSTTDGELMTLVRLASSNWSECSEMSRLRSENRLIKSVRDGRIGADGRVSKGWPGVRIREIEEHLLSKADLQKALSAKLVNYDPEERLYVYKYFMDLFYRLEPVPSERLKRAFIARLKTHDAAAYSALNFMNDLPDTDPWSLAFKAEWEAFQFDDDEIPF